MISKWKKLIGQLLITTLVTALLVQPQSGAILATENNEFHVNPITDLSQDFIKGADVSMLYEIESKGGTFKNDQGEVEDCLVILKDHGVNWIRLRLWNNPYNVAWSSTLTGNGQPVNGAIGGGTNDLARTLLIAKRAKALGLKVLLDFHYSDFWADPGKQYKPQDWTGLSGADLENALYNFTKNTLITMANENVLPDMVQVGNEINGGIVWNDGKGVTSATCTNLLKKGTQAVREIAATYNKPIQIMLHLAEGGDKNRFISAFDAFTAAGIEYDIIGASFYPYWHGTLAELQDNLDTISNRYQKDVVVVETAYAFTQDSYDETDNNFNAAAEVEGGYVASIQGQASFIRDVMETVNQVPGQRGKGIFYWEPDWIAVEGAGWITGAGNAWENQALFDENGKALPSLDVFNLVDDPNNQIINPVPVRIEHLSQTIEAGGVLVLPTTVNATLSDGSRKPVSVSWSDYDETLLDKGGKFEIQGMASGYQVVLNVTVKGVKNLLSNPGFETGTWQGWTVTSTTTNPMGIGNSGENVHSGNYAMKYWLGSAMNSTVSQTFTQLKDGTYNLRLSIMGESTGASDMRLFATTEVGNYETKMTVNGWNNWKQFEVKGIQVVNGQATVGFKIDEAANSWGWIDDIAFVVDDQKLVINGPTEVDERSEFIENIDLTGFLDTGYASKVTISYNKKYLDLLDVYSVDNGTIILKKEETQEGIIVTIAHTKGISGEDNVISLKWAAKGTSSNRNVTISVKAFDYATAPNGQLLHNASNPVHSLVIMNVDKELVSGSPLPEPSNIKETLISDSEAPEGVKPLTYERELGTIHVPGQFFDNLKDQDSNQYDFDIEAVSLETLDLDESNLMKIKEEIGDRPIYDINLLRNGNKTPWHGGNTSVEVTIKYEGNEEEKANPEGVILYTIDENGQLQRITNGHYDPENGQYTFRINHFSYYTLGYEAVDTSIIQKNSWARKALGQWVVNGFITMDDAKENNQQINRQLFINALTGRLGVFENPEVAGIVKGYGNGVMGLDRQLTREQSFTLIYRTLQYLRPELIQDELNQATDSTFVDWNEVSSYSELATRTLIHLGIVKGDQDKINPKQTLTYAQAAVLVQRVAKYLADQK